MITFETEGLYPLNDLPARLRARGIRGKDGKEFTRATVNRWANQGVGGGIRLEVVRAGRVAYTTDSAVGSFFGRLSRDRKAKAKAASETQDTR